MKPLRLVIRSLVFVALTIATQVGGIVYLVSLLLHKPINKRIASKATARLAKVASFVLLYSIATTMVVPFIARPLGRVPMPLTTTHHTRPLTWLTCILNRNYVRPQLRDVAFAVADKMAAQYPGTVVNYLDGNFPFINGFGLLPHLSHNDGKKLDLSFCYNNSSTGAPTNDAPSPIGYGICEEPTAGERNTCEECAAKGYWQYNMLRALVPQGNKMNYTLANERTRALVLLFAGAPDIGKIFIEPHLKTRLRMVSEKIRFQGCHAVRHDDHIHVQLY